MPLPPIDFIKGILPPHLGDPTQSSLLTPYRCTMKEVCQQLATSDARRKILRGLLAVRARQRRYGIAGFQWLGGSFMEDCMTTRGREPGDIDVVTYITHPTTLADVAAALDRSRTSPRHRDSLKKHYSVDHFNVPLSSAPKLVIDQCRYWCGLFSHRRGDELWKGMAHVQLTAAANDDDATPFLIPAGSVTQ